MSDFPDAIKKRRSIRKYKPRPVSPEILLELIATSSYAPSAHNSQPWRFIVITSEPEKRTLAQTMASAWLKDLEKDGASKQHAEALAKSSVDCFSNTPAIVLACITMDEMNQYPDERRQKDERDLALQSLGAAIQTLLLEAHSKGIGSCWCCAPVFCKDAVRLTLKIPSNVEPQALIRLGYPSEEPSAPKRKPVEDFVFWASWGRKIP